VRQTFLESQNKL